MDEHHIAHLLGFPTLRDDFLPWYFGVAKDPWFAFLNDYFKPEFIRRFRDSGSNIAWYLDQTKKRDICAAVDLGPALAARRTARDLGRPGADANRAWCEIPVEQCECHPGCRPDLMSCQILLTDMLFLAGRGAQHCCHFIISVLEKDRQRAAAHPHDISYLCQQGWSNEEQVSRVYDLLENKITQLIEVYRQVYAGYQAQA